MRWIKKRPPETRRYKRLAMWHRWFAWYPVVLEDGGMAGQKKVWLESIERQGRFVDSRYIDESYWTWFYRLTR